MRAVLVSFSIKTNKFESRYEITKFFRELYGWKQIVCKSNRRYEYKRPGLLDEIPHLRIDQSSFLIPDKFLGEIEKFFDEWNDKVIFKTLKVIVEEELEW